MNSLKKTIKNIRKNCIKAIKEDKNLTPEDKKKKIKKYKSHL